MSTVLARLQREFGGTIVGPEHDDYDTARTVVYGTFDPHPAAILRPTSAAQIATAVAAASELHVPLAVRSGGHSNAGHSGGDGAIVLDLREMKAVEIDLAGRTAWAQTGLTAGEFTAAVGEHGLATGFGDTGSVGVGGIATGGGVGFLSRRFGLTVDNILAAEVVTADGRILEADDQTHPDLFWAVRGGGGNFGVVTRLKFRLHDVPSIVGGMLILPATPDVVEGAVNAAAAAPEELSAIINVMTAPPLPFIPEHVHGQLVAMMLICYAGPAEEGERAIAPFRALAEPLADQVGPTTYPEMFPPEPEAYHPIAIGRNLFMDSLGPDRVKLILERIESGTAMMHVAQLRVLGGAISRIPADATAYAHREQPIMANVAAIYQDLDQTAEYEVWVDGVAAELRDGPAAYVNFLGDEGPDRVRDAYPGATWDRLREIKRRYDPANLFRANQNIPPAVA
jgi:FAD/FMN-containing dehydrogenase